MPRHNAVMQVPGYAPLFGDRNVLFNASLLFIGFDFTGATAIRMQIRLNPDAPGTPLVSLVLATLPSQGTRLIYAGADTIANHLAAARLDASEVPQGMADTDMLTISIVGILITKTNMAFSTVPATEEGDDRVLAYDLLVTPAGGSEDKYAYGPFTLRGTVTQ